MTEGWVVPEPRTVLDVDSPDGARLRVRRHGNPDGPRMVLTHGNGMAADAYYPFWSLLTDRFDLFVYDLRSHGWNPVGEQSAHNIPAFAGDCGAVARAIAGRFGEKPVVGVYHSVSALGALLHAQEQDTFSTLVLFDPPVCPPGGTPDEMEPTLWRVAEGTRRRPDRFESPAELAESLRANPVYGRVRPGVHDLLAEATTRPAVDGEGYELCCPKEYEAQGYEFGFGWAMEVDFSRVRCPVKAIGSDPTTPFSFLPSMDLRELIETNYDFLPNTTHFLQLEEPEQCAALAIQFLAEHGFA